MSEQIDWSKAPEDATHYLPGDDDNHECWLKSGFAVRLYRNSHDWFDDFSTHRKIEEGLAIPRPTAPSWSGEGLPPVGVVCEHQHQNGDWAPINVLAHAKMSYGEDVVVFQDGDKITFSNPRYFRPIRTPEQIAAELADQAIKEIAGIICRDGAFDIDDPEVTESAVALYDAGYRKP